MSECQVASSTSVIAGLSHVRRPNESWFTFKE